MNSFRYVLLITNFTVGRDEGNDEHEQTNEATRDTEDHARV